MNKKTQTIGRVTRLAILTLQFCNSLPQKDSRKIVASQLVKSITLLGAKFCKLKYSKKTEELDETLKELAIKSSECIYWTYLIKRAYKKDVTASKILTELREINSKIILNQQKI